MLDLRYPVVDPRAYVIVQSHITSFGSAMSRKFRTALVSATFGLCMLGACTQAPIVDPRALAAAEMADPGCSARQLVSTGGTAPRDGKTLAIRWTGFTNYELVYDGQVILLDTYFDRGSTFPPLGFAASDVKRADLILIGHAHVDHMSDAATVAAKTGAPVVGAPVTTEKLLAQGMPQAQVRTVTGRGREILRFKGFTVEPILGRHGERRRMSQRRSATRSAGRRHRRPRSRRPSLRAFAREASPAIPAW
jgi:hypothetical protein